MCATTFNISTCKASDGSVIFASTAAAELADKEAANGAYTIVYGGETGPEDESMPTTTEMSLVVGDSCQARFTKKQLAELLTENNALVFLTASKFYQQAPAGLVPTAIAAKLQ